MITTYRSLLFEVEEGVATVTLHRPEELNAIDGNMRDDFARLSDALTAASDIRVVIFTGAGRAFSSGGSVSHFEKDWNTDEFRAQSHRLSAFFNSLEMLEKPVIAAMNGIATGAGLQLAMACDLRIAAETARIGFREHWLGLIPGHGGATRLVKLIGLSRAKEIYFSGDLLDAREAHRLGLVNRVVVEGKAVAESKRIARDLARRAPHAIGLTKQLLNAAVDLDLHRGLQLEALAQSIAIKTSDHKEGVTAFREKRSPKFEGK
jgi:enoyl-CoA hydratase/carnithine racemase